MGRVISEKRRTMPHLKDSVTEGREELAMCASLTFVLERTCRGQVGSLAYLQQSGFFLFSLLIPVFCV